MLQKEIQHSTQTCGATSEFKRIKGLGSSLANILTKLPDDLHNSGDAALLKSGASDVVYSIAHLIYRKRQYESHSKDNEQPCLSMYDHWSADYQSCRVTLKNPEIFERPKKLEGVRIFDFCKRSIL
jgi:NTE family protein